MPTSLYQFKAADLLSATALPLYSCAVPAGFPSPADDHAEAPLDLTRLLFRHPASTFLAKVRGDSMTGAGIHPGDLVAVDRALTPSDGSIVVAVLDGEHTIKRLRCQGARRWLEAENPCYDPMPVPPDTGVLVWGVVTHVIRNLAGIKN